jgi:hypothetical protein
MCPAGRAEAPGRTLRTSVLATLTDDGWAKVAATAPGHVAGVRRLVFDPLTPAEARQRREIGRRIMTTVDPEPPSCG